MLLGIRTMRAVLRTVFRPQLPPPPELDRLTMAIDRLDASASQLHDTLAKRSQADADIMDAMSKLAGMMER